MFQFKTLLGIGADTVTEKDRMVGRTQHDRIDDDRAEKEATGHEKAPVGTKTDSGMEEAREGKSGSVLAPNPPRHVHFHDEQQYIRPQSNISEKCDAIPGTIIQSDIPGYKVKQCDTEYLSSSVDMNGYYSNHNSIQRSAYCTMEDKMKRKLKFHFMDPYQKWKARRKFPWKLIIQFVKVVLVTVQVSNTF